VLFRLGYIILFTLFLTSCSGLKNLSNNNVQGPKDKPINIELKKDEVIINEKNNTPDYNEDDDIVNSKDSNIELKLKYSEILKVKPSSINNIKLYELIDTWWNAKYKTPPGKTPAEGIDCSGFAALIQNTIYNKNISGSAASIYLLCKKISDSELKEGDLVFFCCTTGSRDRNKISHVGVYLSNRMFVHASSSQGVVISSLDDPYYWKAKFVKGGRLN
jgi:hypothetical protein